MALRLVAAVLALCWLLPGTALAENLWDHNGSVMQVTVEGSDMVITYEQPRPTIRKQGVRKGTVLFEGVVSRSGQVSGTAYTFRAGCEPADYAVRGTWKPGQSRFVLTGDAPVRVSGGCRITGSTGSGSNARLAFTLIGGDTPDDETGQDETDAPSGASGSITCSAGKAWNGRRCVTVSDPSLIGPDGKPLDGYYMDEDGNIYQDNEGGE